MNSFLTELDTIPKRLNSFRDNISALSSWIVRLKDQALELDYIQIIPSGVASFQENESSLWDNLLFQVRQFVGSFVVDYNVIGNAQLHWAEKLRPYVFHRRQFPQIAT